MKAYAIEKLGDDVKISESGGVDAYRNAVLKLLIDKEEGIFEPETPELKRMIAMLRRSFMKPLKKGVEEGTSKYTLAGQRAEEPLLRAFFKSNAKSLNLRAIYQPGLVENYNNHCERTSADAVVIKDSQGYSKGGTQWTP